MKELVGVRSPLSFIKTSKMNRLVMVENAKSLLRAKNNVKDRYVSYQDVSCCVKTLRATSFLNHPGYWLLVGLELRT